MQVEDFRDSPIGDLVPISGYDARRQREYKHWAFVPRPLPAEPRVSMATYAMIGEADRALGALDARLGQLPNPRLLLRPVLTQEAVSTSALEGTYAPLADVLEANYVDDAKKSTEVREIQNYVAAALRGLELISQRPVCLSVLAELQSILVKKTRGDSHDAGRLRETQVVIGDRGRGIEDSRFIPPPPGLQLQDGVSEWEKWINLQEKVPLLVRVALGHYQFETLHPFSDGNGRIGRLAMTLQLIDAGALSFPVLNLSPWLEPRRDEYIDHLLQVSRTGNHDPWVQFFAEAVKARSDAACATIDKLMRFRADLGRQLREQNIRGRVLDVADDLIGYPVLAVSDIEKDYGVSYPTANSAVNKLVAAGALREITGGNYRRLYRCDPVMEIIRDV